ncbi:metallophosphoesterase family protein [Planctomicrobium sp. SH661]|uniref:metallophosphoesterase family protein n=1 Tax=Planctomicrobium sp. SH661 TaxID=3448124 RepID=UPI003F5BC64B
MRILVVADIHSNWAALSAIREEFDRCVVIGDIVDYGTNPLPCIDWVRKHADASIRGNHDHAVAQRVAPVGTTGYRRLAAATRPLHWDLLDSQRLKFLARLPVSAFFRVEQQNLFLIHATPRDPMDEYLAADEDAWRQRLSGIQADFVCVGHSHLPFHLDLGEIQVVNPGSVGQPRDGDWRASYAIIEDGHVSLKRVEYDLDACLKQISESAVPRWAVSLSEAVLRSGGGLSKDEMDSFQ